MERVQKVAHKQRKDKLMKPSLSQFAMMFVLVLVGFGIPLVITGSVLGLLCFVVAFVVSFTVGIFFNSW